MAVEEELRKWLGGGNTKLSNWIRAFAKASVTVHLAVFIMFWQCNFVFGVHSHYANEASVFSVSH